MSSSVNRAIILGNVGKDPEIRTFTNGGKVASFSVATTEAWKDKATGERKEKTEWHRVSVMNDSIVGFIEKYVKKGMKIYVEGRVETRKWAGSDGTDKFSTEIVLRPYNGEIVLLDMKDSIEKSNDRPVKIKVDTIDDSIPF